MHLCPCGFYNHPEKEFTGAPGAVHKCLNKISGPLLDRIDLHVEVTPVPFNDLTRQRNAEPSSAIRPRVIETRAIQTDRFKKMPVFITTPK